jgi:large subunit ribosomal protein L20
MPRARAARRPAPPQEDDEAGEGYVGGRRKTYRQARETVERGLTYAYRDRKQRKRDFRAL